MIKIDLRGSFCVNQVCLCFTSLQQRGHLETAPHLLSLAKDVKLGKYTVQIGNRTPGRRESVRFATAAPRNQIKKKLPKCSNQSLIFLALSKTSVIRFIKVISKLSHSRLCNEAYRVRRLFNYMHTKYRLYKVNFDNGNLI